MLRALLIAALLLVVVPASAHAATPLVVGQGADPGLAVDAAGTAYLAWSGTETSGTRSLHFCRLPRGATACAGAATIAVPDGSYSLYRPFVAVSGPVVQVTQSRYGFAAGSFDQVIQFTWLAGMPFHTAAGSAGGLATFPWDADTLEALMARADEALLRAKAAGKNAILLHRPTSAPCEENQA